MALTTASSFVVPASRLIDARSLKPSTRLSEQWHNPRNRSLRT